MRRFLTATLILAAAIGCAGRLVDAGEASEPQFPAVPTVVAQVCASCHGAHGNSIDGNVPSLAGQGSPYLERQLAAFKAQGRVGVMGAVAMNLSDAESQEAARYFSQQTLVQTARSIHPAPARLGAAIYHVGIAKKQVPSCASCHALTGEGLPPEFPRLAAQHVEYLEAQLRAFRADRRVSNPNAMMRQVAAHLSDEEIDAVAAYIADMH